MVMSNNSVLASPLHRGSTVADLIISSIARYPDRFAFRNDEAVITYQQLGQQISQIAQYFDSLGLKPGDTVAQLGVNRFEVFAVIVAVYMRGLRSVTLHAMGGEEDHQYVIDDSQARVVIVDPYHAVRGAALKTRCKSVTHWLSLGDLQGFTDLLSLTPTYNAKPLIALGDSEDIVRLAYTGGTTGRSKGVMLSNRALVTNAILDMTAKEWPADVRYLCVAPISHGAGSLVTPTLMRGGCITLLRGFSVNGVIQAINRYACNVTWMVPTMLYGLLDSGQTDEVDWSSFHTLIYSGAPASPSRIRQALTTFGPILLQSYGQTEAPNDILLLGRSEHASFSDAQLASAGRPYPTLRVCLLDESGAEVPDGQRGEICVRGSLVMSGYLDRPEETASTLAGDWLHTGDIAYKDQDGLFYIVDRKKDLIITGGFNVYPKEVEDVLAANPAVAAAAVIGIPDAKWGEMVLAYVQLKAGFEVAADLLIEEVRAAKGSIASPKRLEFIDTLPLTALGKIDKKALRAQHWGNTTRAVN